MNKIVKVNNDIRETVERWQKVLTSDPDRDIIINPFYGHYGLAGYIMTIQGSPIRGSVYVDIFHSKGFVTNFIYIMMGGKYFRPKRIERSNYRNHRTDIFYDDTFEILKWLDLPLETGGEDDLPVVYLKVDEIQPTPEDRE